MARTYSVTCGRTAYATAITILQVVAGSAAPLEIIRAWVSQDSSTAGSQNSVMIVRKSASATGTTACVVNKIDVWDVAASATAGGSATGEGTNSDVVIREAFNTLNGWLYLPVPEERILVPAGSTIAITFPTAPLAASYYAGMVFRELV